MSGQKLRDSRERRRCTGEVPERQIRLDRCIIEFWHDKATCKQALQLRREDEHFPRTREVQGLHTHSVAREQRAAPPFVPDGEGEFPAELLRDPVSEALVEMGEYFRVATAGEAMPRSLQVASKLR